MGNETMVLMNLKNECGRLMDAAAGVAPDESLHHMLIPEAAWNRFCEAVINIDTFDPLDKAMDNLRISGQGLLDAIDSLVSTP